MQASLVIMGFHFLRMDLWGKSTDNEKKPRVPYTYERDIILQHVTVTPNSLEKISNCFHFFYLRDTIFSNTRQEF